MDDVLAVALIIREHSVCGLYHQDRGNCFCDDERFQGDSAYRSECDCKVMAEKIIDALAARNSRICAVQQSAFTPNREGDA